MKTLHSAVFYGRDNDSIASMALGIFGAIYGINSTPIKLQKEVDIANKRNFAKLAEDLFETAKIIYENVFAGHLSSKFGNRTKNKYKHKINMPFHSSKSQKEFKRIQGCSQKMPISNFKK